MTTWVKRSRHQDFDHLKQKLKVLGVKDSAIYAIVSRIKVSSGSKRSEDIVAPGLSPTHSTVLLEGIACLYERLADGSRQIYAFQYPGDFCDLNRHVLPGAINEVAVAAITPCTVGTIRHSDFEQLMAQYPSLASAMWCASMLEASMLRQRLLSVGRRPALQRVAHILCEQTARQEAVGIQSDTIPLSQWDLADAAGLSNIHVNRTFRELQKLGLLTKEGRAMKVVDRKGLASLAAFDGNYLNMPKLLSDWQKRERAAMPGSPSRLRTGTPAP
jgi:CRP-like cAMP-binding protein